MTNQYPYRYNTTQGTASEDDPRYETPGGAANKIEQALEDAKEYTDDELLSYVAQTLNLADDSVTRPKIAPGAVGATELDPSLLDYTTDIAVANKFNEVDAQLADITYNVKSFGALGDGINNDTTAINNCIIAAAEKGVGNVRIPAGIYLIQGATGNPTYHGEGGGIRILSGVMLSLDPGAVLKQIPTPYGNYNIVYFAVADNAGISGGTIIGDRAEHTGSTGEWGYGIGVFSSSNILIENVIIRDCWGDGINTNRYYNNTGMTSDQIQTRELTVDNVTCINNRRQGMSIESLVGGKISNSTFSFTNGTNPQCGIDIEPIGIQIVEDVTINQCFFEGNEAAGILSLNARRITIDSCFFKNNKSAEGQIVSLLVSELLVSNSQLISPLGGGGLRFSDTSDSTVTGNKFVDCSLLLFGCRRILVSSNTVLYVDKTPVTYLQVSNYSTTVCEDVTISNNTTMSKSNSSTNNVFFECVGKNILVKNNSFCQARALLSLGANSYAEIVGNFIIDMSIEGINISASAKAKIENNTFSGICYNNDGQSIIRVRDSSEATITNNMFYKNRIGGGDLSTGRPGIYLRVDTNGVAYVYDNFIDTLAIVNLSTTAVIVPRITYRNLPTTGRPVSPKLGDFIFDTTLNKPIWWTGANWKDAAGTTV